MSVCFPAPHLCACTMIDVQERLCRAIPDFGFYEANMNRMLRVAANFGVDVLVTEQYPQGLGATMPGLAEEFTSRTQVFPKTAFCCWGCTDYAVAIEALAPTALVVFGMETHICVKQTACKALERGFRVIIPVDAVCSRKILEREVALQTLREKGADLTTVEELTFDWLRDAKHEAFREVSQLFR